MLDDVGLIRKHRSRGVVLDANLLLLHLLWKTNPRHAREFTPGNTFEVADFLLLGDVISSLGKLITTPHILTEVSNLGKLRGRLLAQFRMIFKEAVEQMDEFYDESRAVVNSDSFGRLGLTDAAIARLSGLQLLVMTGDLDLYVHLQQSGIEAVNFNHLRPLNWR